MKPSRMIVLGLVLAFFGTFDLDSPPSAFLFIVGFSLIGWGAVRALDRGL